MNEGWYWTQGCVGMEMDFLIHRYPKRCMKSGQSWNMFSMPMIPRILVFEMQGMYNINHPMRTQTVLAFTKEPCLEFDASVATCCWLRKRPMSRKWNTSRLRLDGHLWHEIIQHLRGVLPCSLRRLRCWKNASGKMGNPNNWGEQFFGNQHLACSRRSCFCIGSPPSKSGN